MVYSCDSHAEASELPRGCLDTDVSIKVCPFLCLLSLS